MLFQVIVSAYYLTFSCIAVIFLKLCGKRIEISLKAAKEKTCKAVTNDVIRLADQ